VLVDDPVPAQVAAAARSRGLGEPYGHAGCPGNSVYVFLWWCWGVMVGVFGVDCCLSPGRGVAGDDSMWGRGVTVEIGVIALVGALAMARRGVQVIRHRKLYLYTGGIVYMPPSGRAPWCAPWREVQVYWGPLLGSGLDRYRIVFPQDGRVRFGVGTGGSEKALACGVGPQLRMLSTTAKLPVLLNRLHAGEAVQFGPLTVDSHGVTRRTKTLPWPHIRTVAVSAEANLVITATQEHSITVDMWKIPDISVLLKVAEDARRPR
jgi:hypothetical protein